ncbi:MAG: ParB/RepB/Spo0J family partition protein [Caldimicrobium sp.]|nr:ParB/RepB/Spo0J family partition protein [Caldimicrobium sp.]MCX7613238.1 ParB/RepB/Spo0J family partition protein [Caldimicrobium sp.]MDW8182079.1 ParB/RepB/Spo0J family partition protein [Caldimicrobium sp.]
MKNLTFEFTPLDLSTINLSKRDFLFSFPERSFTLLRSIEKVGILEPPILYPSPEGYLIVCGEGRVKASLHLGWDIIPALVLKPKLSNKDLLMIALESNLWRGLNLVEKAHFIHKAKPLFPEEELFDILERLGFSKHPKWLFFLEKVIGLEETLWKLIAEEKLNPKIVEDLSKLSPVGREEFVFLLQRASLSYSEQREVLQILTDNKKCKPSDRLISEELKEILAEEDFNLRRKKLFDHLEKLKFPNFYPYKEKIRDSISYFKSHGVAIKFSPYLEKREITFNFKATEESELKNILDFLRNEGNRAFRVFE